MRVGDKVFKAFRKMSTSTSEKKVKAIAAMDYKDIDTLDIPETDDWSSAERGKFYRPIKQKLTIRLDKEASAAIQELEAGKGARFDGVESLMADLNEDD